jgi:hypothetical protein
LAPTCPVSENKLIGRSRLVFWDSSVTPIFVFSVRATESIILRCISGVGEPYRIAAVYHPAALVPAAIVSSVTRSYVAALLKTIRASPARPQMACDELADRCADGTAPPFQATEGTRPAVQPQHYDLAALAFLLIG